LACYDTAIQLHRCALRCAVEDFPNRVRFCIDHAIARVLISHFSLADCHRARADYTRATESYVDALQFLSRCRSELEPSERLRHAIGHANLHLQQLWSEFVQQHDDAIPDACRRAYQDGDRRLAQDAGAAVLH
jgi:hypothetical protein